MPDTPDMVVAAPVRPMVRWAGSKRRALNSMWPHLPEKFMRYIEPFCGSACVFYKLSPAHALLNDLNRDLISFYQTATLKSEEVYQAFRQIRRAKGTYYRVRNGYDCVTEEIQRAASFYYLNRNCFNGLYRTNKRGKFNVPYSKSRIAAYPSLDEFSRSMAKLKSAKFSSQDFEQFCDREVKPGDFVYLDPPYYVASARVFLDYQASPFSSDDFVRLTKLLERLEERGTKFLLSYPDCAQIREIRSRWNVNRIRVHSSVSASLIGRGIKYEYLISNYKSSN
jgi:DNA adenine methylase